MLMPRFPTALPMLTQPLHFGLPLPGSSGSLCPLPKGMLGRLIVVIGVGVDAQGNLGGRLYHHAVPTPEGPFNELGPELPGQSLTAAISRSRVVLATPSGRDIFLVNSWS